MLRHTILFTVDIEDWFTDGRQIQIDSWDNYELTLEAKVHALLALLSKHNAKATFFVLGWIARKKPSLIQEIYACGHEIASHSYSHELVYTLSKEKFKNDTRKSKQLLEDIVGAEVTGYRAPCFSITPWALDILQNEGYAYDSSIVPATFHDLYSKLYKKVEQPCFEIGQGFWEISLPALSAGSINIPWGGGGYFRLYPYRLFQYGVRKVVASKGAYTFYIHPYDLDPNQPRRTDYSLLNRLRRYYGLSLAQDKLDKLLGQFACTSITDHYPFLKKANNG